MADTSDHPDLPDGPLAPADWDAMYEGDHLWSGQPNGALVAQVAEMTPSTALDVGCGEGADALWLASSGWEVTALDPSGVALARARVAAAAAGAEVTWVQGTLLDGQLGTYDLVSAQYPAIPHDPAAIEALLACVAPGGTLLFVHHVVGEDGSHHGGHAHGEHARGEHEHGHHHHGHNHHGDHHHGDHDDGQDDLDGPSFDPADYVMPDDVAEVLGDGWIIEIDEVRTRVVPTSGRGAADVDDRVLRARRAA